ncbi:hemicentin-1-like isoform X3 [Dysidea avara]
MTHSPVIPDFPDPPTFPNVVNMSFVTFIDDPIPIPNNMRVEIDCGQVIDQAVMDGGGIANVTWYKNGRPITNNSVTNVVIAADNRSMIITDTFRGTPVQVGTEGFYACEVCVVGRNCFNVTRCTDICVPPNLESDSGTVTPTGPIRSVTCGQDLVLDSFEFFIFQIICPQFNGSDIMCNTSKINGVKVFKDALEIAGSPTELFRVGPVPTPTEDICGTYTFVLESGCGRDVAVSRVTCPGDPPDIDNGPFVPRPDPITPGDKMVQIGTTAYVIDGNDVIIKCNIASGTRSITISWFRNGVEDTSFGNVSTITISNVNDGDIYMCKAENRIGFDEETTMIVVQQIIITHLQDRLVPVGSSVSLTCTSSVSSDVTFSWTRDGRDVTRQSTSTGNTSILTIDKVRGRNAGGYVCTVKSGSSSVMSNTATLTVYGPPTMTIHPTSQLTTVSMSVTLNCEATGRGSITYQWHTRNINEGQWSNISNSNNRGLVVRNLQESQQYRCVVSNEADGTRSNVATVTVLKITTHPSNATVIALQDVTLTCSASIDNVTYSWHRNGNSLPSRSRGRSRNTLTIRTATPPDEGMYYCIASKEGIGVESNRATLTVDVNTVTFEQSAYSVDEDGGSAPLLILKRPFSTPITVQVFTTDGSATGEGGDYGSGQYRVTFPTGVTRVPFDVGITPDNTFEGNEHFTVTIDQSSLPDGVMRGNPGSATVTIVDNDPISVTFEQSTYSVVEKSQPVLVLSNPSSTSFTVQVFNTDGSATGGGIDYDSGPYTVTFPAGGTRIPFDVPIYTDDIFKHDKDFTLTINPSSLPDGVTRGNPGSATVTIRESAVTVSFEQSTYNVDEDDGPAQPVLVLSNPSSTNIIVQVFNIDGSATGGGVDYNSGPYTVTFLAGVTRVPFDVPINNDDVIFEDDEYFIVTIEPSSLPADVTHGSPGNATVTINNIVSKYLLLYSYIQL